jgi:hypothetical protein
MGAEAISLPPDPPAAAGVRGDGAATAEGAASTAIMPVVPARKPRRPIHSTLSAIVNPPFAP